MLEKQPLENNSTTTISKTFYSRVLLLALFSVMSFPCIVYIYSFMGFTEKLLVIRGLAHFIRDSELFSLLPIIQPIAMIGFVISLFKLIHFTSHNWIILDKKQKKVTFSIFLIIFLIIIVPLIPILYVLVNYKP